ncbi:hypothetical protein [uncultured Cellulomonas sp.]|uniref:hypothetical protein n=1 Tax=uncultured Cellulomonas sp. TaxID=189682 RepID=UPI00260ED5B8|nr:hypothetical protein [uncultured Cellulomonas sp.]
MSAVAVSEAVVAPMRAGSGGGVGDLVGTSPAWSAGVSMTVEPTPMPTQDGSFESWEVSPGLAGFIPVFLIALACIVLFLSLTRQMRRVAVRQAHRDALDREQDTDQTETAINRPDVQPRGVSGE